MSRVTLQDLARITDLSVSTVSLALRDSPRIAPKTKERVQEVAEQLGYRAAPFASSPRKARPRRIGLICRLEQELHLDYYRKIARLAREHDAALVIEDENVSGGYIEAMRNLARLKIDALIAVDPDVPSRATVVPVPTVVIAQSSILNGVDLIVSNNVAGMRQVSGLLKQQGVLNVVYLDGPIGVSAKARRDAFIQTASEHGIDVEVVAAGDSVDDGFDATQVLLERPQIPEAIVCYNDHCAQGAIMSLLRAGLKVPADVSVIGYDNTSLAQTRTFAISSVDRETSRIAQLAMDTALERAFGNREAPRTYTVETQLIRRQTTGGVAPVH